MTRHLPPKRFGFSLEHLASVFAFDRSAAQRSSNPSLIRNALSLPLAALLVSAPLVAEAKTFRIDFSIEITDVRADANVDQLSVDVSEIDVDDIFDGFFLIDTAQPERPLGTTNDGTGDFTISELTVFFPKHNALGIVERPGLVATESRISFVQSVRRTQQISLNASRETDPENSGVPRPILFEFEFFGLSNTNSSFATGDLLDADEIANNVSGSSFSYGITATQDQGGGDLAVGSSYSVNGQVTTATAVPVPLPASGALVLAAVGGLVSVRRWGRARPTLN
ncbi:MAG: VPLPA-CTERM sorting domain-containing protein [Pseudomonadota bacterium]